MLLHLVPHPIFLITGTRPQLETEDWFSGTCRSTRKHPLCFVESLTVPQIVPSRGAVPLLIPVVPPGVNFPLWASTGL